jgi:hypothetical protein
MSDRINPSIPIIERPDLTLRLPAVLVEIGARVFVMGPCRIIVSRDPVDAPRPGWHLSISKEHSDPSWDEIATSRYRLLPGVKEMAMYLPSLDEYVNWHPYTFHLHEVEPSRIIVP